MASSGMRTRTYALAKPKNIGADVSSLLSRLRPVDKGWPVLSTLARCRAPLAMSRRRHLKSRRDEFALVWNRASKLLSRPSIGRGAHDTAFGRMRS